MLEPVVAPEEFGADGEDRCSKDAQLASYIRRLVVGLADLVSDDAVR